MRFARRINRSRGWKGHLWQGRFFSSPLEESYLWAAIRYVERNPVRARMVHKAENYCGQRHDTVLTTNSSWRRQAEDMGDWSAWLAQGDEPGELEILRRNADKGLPCGSQKFIGKLERLSGRVLQYRPRGRPGKGENLR
jgi:putative transposase